MVSRFARDNSPDHVCQNGHDQQQRSHAEEHEPVSLGGEQLLPPGWPDTSREHEVARHAQFSVNHYPECIQNTNCHDGDKHATSRSLVDEYTLYSTTSLW